MGKERFMRHYYGPSGYVSPEERKRLETEESSQLTTILGFLVREMARLTRIANKSDYDEGYYDALVAVERDGDGVGNGLSRDSRMGSRTDAEGRADRSSSPECVPRLFVVQHGDAVAQAGIA